MPGDEIKSVQPVKSDEESKELHDKDKYKETGKVDDGNDGLIATGNGKKGASSSAVEDDEKTNALGKKKNDDGNIFKKAAKRGVEAAGQVAGQAVKSMMASLLLKKFFAFLLAYMQSFITTAASTFLGWAVAAWNSICSFGASIWAGFMGFCSTVGSFIGVSVTAVAATTGTLAATTLVAGTVVVSSYLGGSTTIAERDALIDNCAEEFSTMSSQMSEVGDMDSIKLDNAKKIYSVLKAYGLADENISGVLGNFEAECGIDPTGVEGVIGVEHYTIGPRKQAAIDADFRPDGCLIDGMSATAWYLSNGWTPPTYIGIGLAGFTWDANPRLRKFAESYGKQWYDLDAQLAFSLCPYDQGGFGSPISNFMRDWQPSANPTAAAQEFAKGFEGNTVLAQDTRASKAEEWFVQIKTWTVDKAYADSVLAMAKTTGNQADSKALSSKGKECKDVDLPDNSSIASAAVAYAWPTEDQGVNNDGTELYRKVHDLVLPGDVLYQSCDRSVASAVRWAGADDDFAYGGCSSMLAHMIASDRWEEVDWNGDESKLQPSDVLIVSNAEEGHVILYVGNEMIKAKYPDAADTYKIVSGSIAGEGSPGRSPGCGALWSSYGHYRAFRNVKPETNSKYKNVIPVAEGGVLMGDATGLRSAIASGQLSWPVSMTHWTTYPDHSGVDIPISVGTPIYASADGVVKMTQTGLGNMWGMSCPGWTSYGNCVFLTHANGVETRYGHMSNLIVSQGNTVKRGQIIGYSGNTGNSSGPHLHFEVLLGGERFVGGTNYAALGWPQYGS